MALNRSNKGFFAYHVSKRISSSGPPFLVLRDAFSFRTSLYCESTYVHCSGVALVKNTGPESVAEAILCPSSAHVHNKLESGLAFRLAASPSTKNFF